MNEQYLAIGRVARWATILLAAIVVLDIVAAFSDLAEIRPLLWLASTYADQVALRLAFTGDTADELRNGSIAYLVTNTVDAVLAVLAIVVVRMTTARQEERAAALEAAYGALPADDET